MRRKSRKVGLDVISTMHRVKVDRQMMSYRCARSTGACICIESESQRRSDEKQNENDPVPNLTGSYLSTGMELD
jgi:hypothetical protein